MRTSPLSYCFLFCQDDYEEVSTYQPPSTTDDDLSEMDDALKTYLETKE